MNIKLAIFDLDNTLYNEEDYLRSGYKEVAKQLSEITEKSEKSIYRDMIQTYKNGGGFETFQKYLKNNSLNEELLKNMIKTYRYHVPSIKITQKKKKFLKALSEKGVKLAMITNGDVDRQMIKIKALKIEDLFDYILITGKYGNKRYWKPHSRGYKEILKHLKCKPEETLFVGDNPKIDIDYPLSSGMTVVITTEFVCTKLSKKKKVNIIKELTELRTLRGLWS